MTEGTVLDDDVEPGGQVVYFLTSVQQTKSPCYYPVTSQAHVLLTILPNVNARKMHSVGRMRFSNYDKPSSSLSSGS